MHEIELRMKLNVAENYEEIKSLEHHVEKLLDLDNWPEIESVYDVEVTCPKRKAIDIKWETDDEDICLPNEIAIPEHVDNDDVGEYLSDETGFLHDGYKLVYDFDKKKDYLEIIEKTDEEALGEIVWDIVTDYESGTMEEIGDGIRFAISECKTEKELHIAELMLIAVTGSGLDTIIKDRLADRIGE